MFTVNTFKLTLSLVASYLEIVEIIMTILLKEAKIIAEGCLATARELKLKPISVVVLDARGSLVFGLSEDGVSKMRAQIAHGKADAAIALGMGTRSLMERAEQQPYFIQAMNGLAGGSFVPVPGGVLILGQAGAVLGAIGVSGDTSDNDEKAALGGVVAAGLNAESG